jgi:tRNA pseudouridine38-40 synthase
MRNIKIIYQYDGSDFFGFQRQVNERTVQGELEKGLKKMLREEVKLVSSGRTDRGVHARMQVSNFKTNSTIPIDKLPKVLDSILPKDIKIIGAEEVPLEFHARFSAKTRAYEFILGRDLDVFEARYVTEVEKDIEVEKLEKIMKVFIGKHNFDSFRMADCGGINPVREIYEVRCYKKGEKKFGIYIKGSAFLKTQIRIMVGTALAVYWKKKPENYIEEKLENPNLKEAKLVIDGSGLYLYEVSY